MNSSIHRRGRGIPSFTRLTYGLTQQQLADSLGVSRSAIAMMETGKRALPAAAKQLYDQLSGRSTTVLPTSTIAVKRGRKPHGYTPGTLPVSFVTNYKTVLKDVEKLTEAKKKPGQQFGSFNLETSHGHTIAVLRREDQCEEAIKQIEAVKRKAEKHLELLQFKRNAADLNWVRLTTKIKAAEAGLEHGVEVIETFPDETIQKEFRIKNAYNKYRKAQLCHRLKKYDRLAMLDMELQIGMLERGIELAGEYIADLKI